MTTSTASVKGNVFITGASGGIGSLCAVTLDRLGYRVFAGIRNPEDGGALQRRASQSLIPVQIDVTNSDSLSAAVTAVTQTVGSAGLTALINNAGIIVEGAMELVPMADLREQFEVNVLGPVAVTQAFLPLLRQGHGRIITISAVTAKVTIPMLGPISASKAALESLTDALRMELRAWQIPVSIIEPAAIQTGIFAKSATRADAAQKALSTDLQRLYGNALSAMREANAKTGASSPQVVVDAIVEALTAPQPRTRYVVGKGARTVLMLRWLSDRTRDSILAGQMGLTKALKQNRS